MFERDGMLLATSDWLQARDGEEPFEVSVRYRTVGDMTITGAVESDAADVETVIEETKATRLTERGQTRARPRVRGVHGRPQARGLFLVVPPLVTDLMRLATAGSVDDGKSTLIGRLLYDAKALMSDQVADAEVDLAQMTDGLRAEREQGITIDVAYRYFATPRRSFIIADTPGHVRYTRNMVTGASTADLAVVLIDARNGVVEQSRRHACLSALLGLRHVVFCVNKMDLVDWDENRFREIEGEARELAERLGIPAAHAVPISALEGGNVVARSDRTAYYDGPPLLELLETVKFARDRNLDDVRLPVQWVVRPRDAEPGEHRLYAGQLASGVLRAGDELTALPEGAKTRIESVETADGPLEEAFPPMSVLVRLADDLDVGRGDLLASPDRAPTVARELEATICWMADAPLRPGAKLRLRHTTRTVRATVEALLSRTDVTTLDEEPEPDELALNDIGRIRLLAAAPVMADPYATNRITGAFILVDEQTRDTVAAGMIRSATEGTAEGMDAELAWEEPPLPRNERWDALRARGATVWLRGTPEHLAGAAAAAERALVESGRPAYLIDGGLAQQGLAPGRLARLFADSGAVAVVGLPSAAAEVRRQARELHALARLEFVDLDVPDGEDAERTAERVLEALRAD